MKIAIIVYKFLPEKIGGTEVATYYTAKYLSELGHEIHVITTSLDHKNSNNDDETFIIHRVPTLGAEPVNAILFQMLVVKKIVSIKPDIIHVQNIALGLSAWVVKKYFKTPYLVYGRGSDVYGSWPLKKIISKVVLRTADAVVALSENMRREIKNIEQRDVIIIPNGIELGRFQYESKDSIRKTLKFNDEDKIIIFVGNLRKVKGVEYLIESMKEITEKEKNAKLIILGDGEERSDLEELVSTLFMDKYIKFLGRISNESIPKYMMASDLFVLPSVSESFGIVNLEAMASGLPIVATKVGGVPEIIKENINGLLVEPRNSIDLSLKIIKLLHNQPLAKKISNNNKSYVKNFSWVSVILKLNNVYIDIINNYKLNQVKEE